MEKRLEPQQAPDLEREREKRVSNSTPVSSLGSWVSGVPLTLRRRAQGKIAPADSWRVDAAGQE